MLINEGVEWKRMRGIWFDAFCELLDRLELPVDRGSAWSLWRRFVSFKYDPVIVQKTPGFVTIRDFKETLFALMRDEPFLSDTTFLEFNEVPHLQLGQSRYRSHL